MITRMGLPITLTYGSEAAITSIATVFMGTFGPLALGASNIVNQLAYIVYQLNIGLSQGSSILVSRTVSKGQADQVSQIARRTFAISFSAMAIIGLVYVFLPEIVLLPFLGGRADPSLFGVAATLLWFAIAHQFFKGSQNICVGLLRGVGNEGGPVEYTCGLLAYRDSRDGVVRIRVRMGAAMASGSGCALALAVQAFCYGGALLRSLTPPGWPFLKISKFSR